MKKSKPEECKACLMETEMAEILKRNYDDEAVSADEFGVVVQGMVETDIPHTCRGRNHGLH